VERVSVARASLGYNTFLGVGKVVRVFGCADADSVGDMFSVGAGAARSRRLGGSRPPLSGTSSRAVGAAGEMLRGTFVEGGNGE
jgi:hypothetical protein